MNARKQWKVLFGGWRMARRNLLRDGAIEQACCYVKAMRELTGNWELPSIATRLDQYRPVYRNREYVCARWHGPYRCGRIGALSR